MRTMTVTVPDTIPIVPFIRMMHGLGLSVSFDGNQNISAQPISPDQHANANVVAMPRHKRQHTGCTLPSPDDEHGPEGPQAA